jgi:hypothetical protein
MGFVLVRILGAFYKQENLGKGNRKPVLDAGIVACIMLCLYPQESDYMKEERV